MTSQRKTLQTKVVWGNVRYNTFDFQVPTSKNDRVPGAQAGRAGTAPPRGRAYSQRAFGSNEKKKKIKKFAKNKLFELET